MEKIAVIGLSCLFPGAQNPQQFWQNLISQTDSTSLATEEQMGVDPDVFYDPEKGKSDYYYCTRGGFIRDFSFDPSGYQISAEFLESLDNIFKWSLYVSKQALEDSGYLGNTTIASNCGVILGNLSSPTRFSQRLISPIYRKTVNPAIQELLQQQDFRMGALSSAEGLSVFNMMTAGYPTAIIAQALSLLGPHFSIDAACSSGLYTVKLACQYLLSRKVDLMLAGAVSCADSFVNHTGFSLIRAHPEGGIGKPLDRSSTGLVTGEGAGILVLKRYSDAVREGDKIYATICGVGVSNDGRGKHFLSPNPKGQILAFERAYADASVDPQSVHYVECHATGTDLGDKTELNSMDDFFGRYGARPLVGSVKSNIGHLLTAAGMPSLIKVILSMSNGVIPPTIHLNDPLCSANQVIASEQIVRSLTPWISQMASKRSGISAFGFGGNNAHLVLEHAEGNLEPSAETESIAPTAFSPLAIVGMDTFFGACDGLDAFERSIYTGKQHFTPVPPERWKGIEDHRQLLQEYGFEDGQAPQGAFIKDFEMDFLHFKIPPNPEEQPIPQQLLILKVADRALQDAGLKQGENVAVIIAMETDLSSHQYRARCDSAWQIKEGLAKAELELPPQKIAELEDIVKSSLHLPAQVSRYISYIGNIMASRISAAWDFAGPSFTLSAEENSVFKALEVAQLLLAQGEVDAVVVGAVDLAGGVENVLLRNQMTPVNTGTPTLGYDQNANGWMVGEGAGAVVLKRLDIAQQNQDRIYAAIDAVSLVQENYSPSRSDRFPSPPSAECVAQTCNQSFQQAGVQPKDIGYLEVFASGIAQEDAAEIVGLTQAYQTKDAELSCAIGSVKTNIGHTFTASGIASLIKTALCLYHRYIPATPNWSAPKQPEAWQNSPFYVAPVSTLWSLGEEPTKRVAALNGLGLDRSYAHVILSEVPNQKNRSSQYLEQTPFFLFPIAGSSEAALLEHLETLQHKIEHCMSLAKIAAQAFADFQTLASSHNPLDYVVAIVGHNKDELNKEIQRALKGLPNAFAKDGEWTTPLGSYFTAKPLGRQGGIAFVYPGVLTSYLEQGRDIYRLFPNSYNSISSFSSSDRLKKVLHQVSKLIYPRSLTRLTARQLEMLESQLLDDAAMISIPGTIAALLCTMVMQHYFQVQPQSAFGYSLGEFSMMFALNIWGEADQCIDFIEASPLFKTRLSGPKNAVRDYWGLPQSTEEADESFWSTYVVMAPVSAVMESLNNESRVYLTHINTPQEVVIAGDQQGCLRVIERLKCDSFRAPASHALHCDPMLSEYNELATWLALPTQRAPKVDFYSAAAYERISLESQDIANGIAKALCNRLDFPRLIHRVYEDGARIFIELGPGGTCTRWIRETLSQKEHAAMFLNNRGVDVHTSVVRVLAKLVSHQTTVDLSPLYSQDQEGLTAQKTLIKTVTVGGCGIQSTILTEKNREAFAPYQASHTLRSTVKDLPKIHDPLPQSKRRTPSKEPASVKSRAPQTPAIRPPGKVFEKKQARTFNRNVHHNYPAPMTNIQSSDRQKYEPKSEQSLSHSDINYHPSHPVEIAQPIIHSSSAHYHKLNDNLSHVIHTHAAFLRSRQESLKQMSQLIQQQIEVSHNLLAANSGQTSFRANTSSMHSPLGSTAKTASFNQSFESQKISTVSSTLRPLSRAYRKPDNIVFDEDDILETANGKISRVFGKEYEVIDSYPRCTRVPMPPYLFMSRVTKLEAKRGCFEPCLIETEYDVPHDAWYTVDGQVPCAVPVEASHGNIFLASYLGVDFEFKGQRVYRALGGSTTFLGDSPQAGEILRCKIKITSFSRGGDTLLFFFTHECFVGDRLFLKMDSGAGFFSESDLNKGQGIALTKQEQLERSQIQKHHFTPLLQCHKSTFDEEDILHLSEGNLAACFGASYDQKGRNPSLRMPRSAIRMIDRVTFIDQTGGAWGLGLIKAEKTLNPGDWYFNCHFKDDFCMPGTVIGEGCAQLMQFYLLYLGLQTYTVDARFQPIPNLTQTGRYRGQVTSTSEVLTYQLEITEIGLNPKPYVRVDAFVIFRGKTISIIKNMGAQLSEKR